MIKTEEIRLGNWFTHNGKWSKQKYNGYFQWKADDWYGLGECCLDLSDVEPIPMSSEILEKCGLSVVTFPKRIEDIISYCNNNGTVMIIWNTKYNKITLTTIHGVYGGIQYERDAYKYLHELQNIVFYVCGFELEVNLKSK